ncbi:hypothetical protein DM45_1571 [Burkholderia mallei]|nr:hypothetical protein DM75_774 [Burkholderia mallei]KOS80684.1 hypothetical protein DM45_1571 [Burkholderia mallei]
MLPEPYTPAYDPGPDVSIEQSPSPTKATPMSLNWTPPPPDDPPTPPLLLVPVTPLSAPPTPAHA